MAEEQKRFPWWLVAGVVLVMLLAAAMGFIETVGRQGTIVGRYERITIPMPYEEAYRLLGRPADELASAPTDCEWDPDTPLREPCTRWTEGPADVWVQFGFPNSHVVRKALRIHSDRLTLWHVRRWAEKTYTAIHGPHR